nr:vegetative cell wall protein gp1-like [Aegilops tauschii subsp. strangulata]
MWIEIGAKTRSRPTQRRCRRRHLAARSPPAPAVAVVFLVSASTSPILDRPASSSARWRVATLPACLLASSSLSSPERRPCHPPRPPLPNPYGHRELPPFPSLLPAPATPLVAPWPCPARTHPTPPVTLLCRGHPASCLCSSRRRARAHCRSAAPPTPVVVRRPVPRPPVAVLWHLPCSGHYSPPSAGLAVALAADARACLAPGLDARARNPTPDRPPCL